MKIEMSSTGPLKLVLISTPIGYLGSGRGGGVELTIISLIKGLISLGHKIILVAPKGSKIPFESNGKLLGPKNVWLKLMKVVEVWVETHLQRRITSLQMIREIIISNDLNTK